MPELPEVETIRRGLAENLGAGAQIREVHLRRRDLRVAIPKEVRTVLNGKTICGVRRRAKFLLFDIGKHTLISHLGMSGSWRFINHEVAYLKHDHVGLKLGDGRELVFHDPRRFGLLLLAEIHREEANPWLRELGLEPLATDWTAADLVSRAKGRDVPVKNFLMDQKVIVGIGNIYASEILYRAGVRPSRRVSRLSRDEWANIAISIRDVLLFAINHGGTTLRDYRTAEGTTGEFKSHLRVYGRAGEPCRKCQSPIRLRVMAGRSTYWCQECQR